MIADLISIFMATDKSGRVYEYFVEDYSPIKVRVMWIKMQELINHVNNLEEKLLSAEERMEAEDIKKADEALKRNNFVDLPETFGKPENFQ